MLTISLEQLQFHATIGVYPEEKIVGNDFLVDVDIHLDEGDPCISELSQTIDYVKIYEIIAREMKGTPVLLETVAQNCIRQIRNTFSQISGIKIAISKLHPPLPGEAACSKITLVKNF